MKLYVLEWYMIDTYDCSSGVVGVYSSREIAELGWETSSFGGNDNYYNNITKVFLDREII